MTNNVPLGFICVLAITLTIVFIGIFVIIHRLIDARNTKYPWCYGDWQCRAPRIVDAFNSVHPAACANAACTPGEEYNVYDMNNSENPKENCKDPSDDSEAVVVNLKTGCQCISTTTTEACTPEELKDNVAGGGCEQKDCGRFNINCGTFLINVPTDTSSYYSSEVDPESWECPGNPPRSTTANGTTYHLCSFACPKENPNPLITSDFFMNAFVYRYKNEISH